MLTYSIKCKLIHLLFARKKVKKKHHIYDENVKEFIKIFSSIVKDTLVLVKKYINF